VVNEGDYGEGPGTLSSTENALLTVMCYWECTGSLAVPRNLVYIFDNQSLWSRLRGGEYRRVRQGT
jgi:hypothetical protein